MISTTTVTVSENCDLNSVYSHAPYGFTQNLSGLLIIQLINFPI